MSAMFSGLMATAIATSFTVASVVPAVAAPIFHPNGPESTSMVEQVRHDQRWRGGGYYMNGHHGYHDYHRHNDFWAPAGAFIAGTIIGSALNHPHYVEPRYAHPSRYGRTHWCYNRYYGAYEQCYSHY